MKTRHSIGIDVGGTNTDIGLVREDGKIIDKVNFHTNEYYDAELYVNDMAAKIKELLERALNSRLADVGADLEKLGLRESADLADDRVLDALRFRHLRGNDIRNALFEHAIAFQHQAKEIPHERLGIVCAVQPSFGRCAQRLVVGFL